MSYDIYLQIDTGAEETVTVVEVGNYTTNVSGMWAEALGFRLYEISGRTAADAVPDLDRAIAAMQADPDTYQAMNPKNGWGDYSGALEYLRTLRNACVRHPKTQIYVSH